NDGRTALCVTLKSVPAYGSRGCVVRHPGSCRSEPRLETTMACSAEANGTTITCACAGCGIAYNHSTRKYHILCCRTITEIDAKLVSDPGPRRPIIEVDLSHVTLLEAAQLLDRVVPGKIKVNGSLNRFKKRVTLKTKKPMSELIKKLKLNSARI